MLLLMIAGLLILCARIDALTNVGGILLQNTRWMANNGANPYYLTGDVQIPFNVTLTIGPGVHVFFNNSDREIFVKGTLKVQGTFAQPVRFMGGLASDSKWMITIQSTNLSQCSITNSVFRGPKRALQLSNTASGLEQNTGTLVLQEVILLDGTEVAANGYYPRFTTAHIPSLEIRSSQIRDSTISSMNSDGESIRISETLIDNSTLKPAVSYDGIQFLKSTLKNMTVFYKHDIRESKIEVINSTVINITALQADYSYSSPQLIFRSSVIHNLSILFRTTYSGPNLTLIESIINNLLITDPPRSLNSYYYVYYSSVQLKVINSSLNTGNIWAGSYRGSIYIDSSNLNKVHISAVGQYASYYDTLSISIRNTDFRNGSITLPGYVGQIVYSNITLAQPPLNITRSLVVTCSSITRMLSIQQSNTTGITTNILQMTRSSVSNFDVGLHLNPSDVRSVNITNSNFENNFLYNINNTGPYHVNASGNWWGSPDSIVISRKILDYWDDIHLGIVFVSNYSLSKLRAEKECPAYVPTMFPVPNQQ